MVFTTYNMRFKINNKKEVIKEEPKIKNPKIGDIRTDIKFALFPIKFKGYKVWLERYSRTYEYREVTKYYTQSIVGCNGDIPNFLTKSVAYKTEDWCLISTDFV